VRLTSPAALFTAFDAALSLLQKSAARRAVSGPGKNVLWRIFDQKFIVILVTFLKQTTT